MSEIRKFYDGTHVFVTGGTGFLGKILIEKLLRSTDVEMIYVLVREKKNKNMAARMNEFFDDIIFQRLKQECPKFEHRVQGVTGDCAEKGLGLSYANREMLTQNVHVVFHAAATVNFDEPLKLAYRINVNSTMDCIQLCRQMPKLKAFVHVSTAYANCIFDVIDEKFYDYPVRYDEVGKLIEKFGDDEIKEMTSKILGKWPNTYTFTKAMAEAMIKENSDGIPIGVYRPAIVISTYKEPFEGWINNLYGPTGVCVGAVSGVMRTLHCDKSALADLVPVDTCVAGLIATAWDVANRNTERKCENIPIYNYVSSVENPITWQDIDVLNYRYGQQYPFLKSIWAMTFTPTSNKLLYNFQKLCYHYIPALAVDCLSAMLGKKPRFVRTYKKLHKYSSVISHFAIREWMFCNSNTVNLWDKMNDTDRKLFPMSMKQVAWLVFFRNYVKGVRTYLLRDPVETLPIARARQKKLKIVHETLKYTTYGALFHVVSNQFFNLVSYVSGLKLCN